MDIGSVGVIGAGQMGSGIAQVAAQAGLDVVLLDANGDLAAKSRATIDKLVQKGKLEAAAAAGALEKIKPSSDYAALKDCQLVVEAAPENLHLKVKIFRAIDEATAPEAILASNTSSISITKIAAAT